MARESVMFMAAFLHAVLQENDQLTAEFSTTQEENQVGLHMRGLFMHRKCPTATLKETAS